MQTRDLRRTVILNKCNSDQWFGDDEGQFIDDKLLVVSDDNNKAETCYNCKHCERGNTWNGKPMPLCKQGSDHMQPGNVGATALHHWCPFHEWEGNGSSQSRSRVSH